MNLETVVKFCQVSAILKRKNKFCRKWFMVNTLRVVEEKFGFTAFY